MYAKCTSTKSAGQVFEKIGERDLVSWNSMLSSDSQNGYDNEEFTCFHQMQLEEVVLDLVSMVSVIQSCP